MFRYTVYYWTIISFSKKGFESPPEAFNTSLPIPFNRRGHWI